MTTSTTEYRVSRRSARIQEAEVGGGEELELVAPEELAAGSQRIEARVAPTLLDPWSTFDAETAEIDLPELADPAVELTRTRTEPMPDDELAIALAASSETLTTRRPCRASRRPRGRACRSIRRRSRRSASAIISSWSSTATTPSS